MTKAEKRLADREELRGSFAAAPSLPDGRYRGTRSISPTAIGETAAYDLTFTSDGSVQGMMTQSNGSSNAGVYGWYNSRAKEFQWVETNVMSFEGTSYLAKLMDISQTNYNGPERLTEVSLKVADANLMILNGEFISSSGSQGGLELIFEPHGDNFLSGGDGPSTPNPRCTIELAEIRKSMLEPTLEKESP